MIFRCMALVTLVTCVSPGAVGQARPVPFLVEFGGTARSEDQGEYLSESMNGDIIVAGYGGPRNQQFRLPPTSPMLARVDRDGNLLWQRIFPEFSAFEVLGLISDERGDFVVLVRSIRLVQSDQFSGYHEVELRKIGADGDLSEVVRHLDAACVSGGHRYVDKVPGVVAFHAVTDSGPPGLADKPICQRNNGSTVLLRTDGSVQIVPRSDGYLVEQYLESGEFLLVDSYDVSPNPDADAPISWYSVAIRQIDGTVRKLLQVQYYGTTRGDIFATPVRMFEFHSFPSVFNRRPVVTTYSNAGELLAERDSGVFDMRAPSATPEGGLVALGLGLDDKGPIYRKPLVFEVSPAGDVVWRTAFPLEQGISFALNTAVMRDGWIAITGWTGPLSTEIASISPHNQRQAFLLVAERSAESVAAVRNPQRTMWFANPESPAAP